MKLLIENWREYLNEEMVTLEKWPEGYSVEIYKNPSPQNAYEIVLYSKYGEEGHCYVEKVNIKRKTQQSDDIDCADAYQLYANLYTMHLEVDKSSRGFGPFLTDLALELAALDNKLIIPAKLVGGAGTADSERLYNFYLNNRKYVNKQDIDLYCWEDFTNSIVPDNTPESFLYLYSKKPEILNSELSKKVIKIID